MLIGNTKQGLGKKKGLGSVKVEFEKEKVRVFWIFIKKGDIYLYIMQ
jgi:hypothetical protein